MVRDIIGRVKILKLFLCLLKILDKNNPIIVWGSGEQCRTYLHADDCARIMKIILQNGFTEGPVNIGLDKTISIKDLVNLICKVTKFIQKLNLTKLNLKVDLSKDQTH